jgi:hypothetical protein
MGQHQKQLLLHLAQPEAARRRHPAGDLRRDHRPLAVSARVVHAHRPVRLPPPVDERRLRYFPQL